MKQQEYDTIVSCVQFGAPALAPSLITTLNKTLENSNRWNQHQKKLEAANAEQKDDIKKAE